MMTIALDVGTTHIKAALFHENGAVVRTVCCATPLQEDIEGSFYDPQEISEIVNNLVNQLIDTSSGKPCGISITGMAEAGLIVDRREKKVLSVILPWFDKRTCAIADRACAAADHKSDGAIGTYSEEELFKRTGLRNSYKYGMYKFLWLLEHENINRENAIWLSMCDYAAFCLTGQFATDPSFAARTYLYDITAGEWDIERMSAYGFDQSNFPQVSEAGVPIGEYKGIPVALAGHDHICAAFSALYHNAKGICDSMGTSETYIGLLSLEGGKEKTAFVKESGLLYGPYADKGYFYMANIPSSGHSVEWFRKKVQMKELEYAEMNLALAALPKEPTGILYFPYLTGMGAPLYDAGMQGALLGLTERQNGIEVLKGIAEGIQYQAKWLLKQTEKFHGTKADLIYCAGGAVQNKALMQIKADVLGIRTAELEVGEATMCGAAALFLYKNRGNQAAADFLKRPSSVRHEYLPDIERGKRYDDIFYGRYMPMVKYLLTPIS